MIEFLRGISFSGHNRAVFHRVLVSFLIALSVCNTAIAQKKPTALPNTYRVSANRCGTMEYYAKQKLLDPLLDEKARAIANAKLKALAANPANANRPLGTQAIISIPIVFHVVGTTSIQAFANDEMLRRQVDVLNRDFAGLNPDTAKLPAAFKALLAHSNIRFVLAKRTPSGAVTTGIDRRVTSQTFTSESLSYNTILKHTAAGGLDQWDGSKYYNVWLANFTDGILGIASFPNVNPPLDDEQGVVIHYGSLDQGCNSPFAGAYDLGRSLVHETGHYFYLFHIWGDDGNACTGSDFDTPFGSLPSACNDDTPNQAGSTDGCPSGIRTDACSPTPPGIMYQNYMDYTSDACYGMFTLAQECRVQATLSLYRSTLLTSDGLTPVSGNRVNNDIRVSEILNPNSRGYVCGGTTNVCTSLLDPQVLIVNNGDAAVTSLTFDIKIDGVSIGTQAWTGNLLPGDITYVHINSFNSPPGTHILTIKAIKPNGQPDGRPDNDSTNSSYSILAPAVAVPLAAQSFESAAFPPANWRVINPDAGSLTWTRTTAAGNPGNASAILDGFNYEDIGQQDYLVSPKLLTGGYDSLIVNFNLAYAVYSTDPAEWETLEVVYSEDCGKTWKPTGYKKTGTALATNGGASVTSLFVPTATEWRNETVKISTCGIGSEITIGFRSTNSFGNDIYLDNISFDKFILPDPNVELRSVRDPNGLYCNGSIQPAVIIFNKGNTTLTSLTLTYNIDGGSVGTFNWTGSLPKCSTPITVALPNITVPAGNHVFTIYSSLPNGMADKVTSNDTLRSSFSVIPIVSGDVSEGFESPVFPPLNWAIQNFDNSTTWMRTTETARTGVASMVIKNYEYPTANTIDKFVSPRIALATYDSAFVSFDYAYRQGKKYPGSTNLPLDTLELVITTDCGLTTTTIWKKWGADLQTISDPNYSTDTAFRPLSVTQWRNIKIEISPQIKNTQDFQVYFVAKSNKQNNLYIDNINIYGKVLPARLKSQGYLIYPIPFGTTFRIHHLVAPVDLRAAQVYNAAGQLVWDKRYSGNANTEELVNMGNMARGFYILKMVYTNKTIVEKVVKD